MPEITCLFKWTETYTNNKGDPIVTCYENGHTWGRHRDRDSKWVLRIKFLELVITNFVRIPLITVPYRIVSLLKGDYKRHGEKAAYTLWINSGDCRKENDQKLLDERKRVEIDKEFWEEIEKIVAFPLELIGLFFACVIGFFSPYDGRALYGYIEDRFSRRKFERSDYLLLAFNEYTAPCMQDDLTYHARKNLTKFNYYDKEDENLLAFSSIHRLEKYQPVFSRYFDIREFQKILFENRKRRFSDLKELKEYFKQFVKDEVEGVDHNSLKEKIESKIFNLSLQS